MELTTGIKDLYQRLQAIKASERVPDDVEKLEVDDIASKLAQVYEKVRNTIDYKEDQLLRRFAIERAVRRKLVVDTVRPKMARPMIEDLIRGHYLPNDDLPVTIVKEVEVIIEKYQLLFHHLSQRAAKAKNKKVYYDWIVSIMACEIDLVLAPEDRGDALVEALYQYVKDRIKIKGRGLSIREKNIQLYVVIHKDLLLSDNSIISYHLFNLYFPDWLKNGNSALIEYVAEKIPSIYLGIQKHLENNQQEKIKKALKKELAMFKVLKQLLEDHQGDLTEVLAKPSTFEDEARKTLRNINGRIRKKITRRSIRAIVYIFLTKMVLAFILEYPYDVWIVGHVNYFALGTNIVFPAVLMFAVALTAKMPKKENDKVILDGLKNYVYGTPEEHTLVLLKNTAERSEALNMLLYTFYFILYAIVFGFIISFLRSLQFNWLSIALFIFFVTVVSFFAMRIREQAKEFSVIKQRQGVILFLLNFFSLPIIKLGHQLSANMRRVNLFIFIFDFILEAPFKVFVETFEGLVGFLREKREEIYKE